MRPFSRKLDEGASRLASQEFTLNANQQRTSEYGRSFRVCERLLRAGVRREEA